MSRSDNDGRMWIKDYLVRLVSQSSPGYALEIETTEKVRERQGDNGNINF